MGPCKRKLFVFFNYILESDMALPELTDIDDPAALADIYFQVSDDQTEYTRAREWLHHWKAPDQSVTLSFAREEDTLFLHFPGMACFEIGNNGHLVTCHARPSLSSATIRHLLLDQVLPRLFAHFFSCSVFHASFVVVNGKGICFLADSGWGKSTIAAGLGGAGHTILTDDCLSIAVRNHRITGTPAYCGIRLLADSLEKLGGSLKTPRETVAEYTSKKRISLAPQETLGSLALEALPLQALFLLTSPQETKDCHKPEIVSVGGISAMKELLKNSFCLDVHDQQWQQAHFRRVSAVAASGLPIFSLRYPRKYQTLPEVEKVIIKTLDQLSR
ncbi:MAG: hypothetical protein KJ630_06255 [Proteobacteria bacterium]|nr:hypothetical protein [Pseudomonadota bacterium]